jgi:hypothetical protein
MTFRGKDWQRYGNHYDLVGTSIKVYQWNSGKNANFLVSAGYRISESKEITISGKGQDARDRAIETAYSLRDSGKFFVKQKN